MDQRRMTTPLRPRTAAFTDHVALWAAMSAAGIALTEEQIDLALQSLAANRWALRFEAEAAPDLRAALERLVSAAEAVAEVENTSIMDRALEQARAALAAPAADGLDVERLTKAIAEVYGWEPSLKDTEADKIAAAYLREPSREPRETLRWLSQDADDLGIYTEPSRERDGRSIEQQMIDGGRRPWPSREPGEEG